MVIQQELIKEIIYDPETGVFYRRATGKRIDFARSKRRDDYRIVCVNGTKNYAHRLAFLYMKGYIPNEVDHIDLDKSNNAWCNLRECTHDQNMQNQKTRKNNRSGVKGVHWCEFTKRWRVQIRVSGKTVNVGRFDSLDKATVARAVAAEKYCGDFARHG